MKQRIGILFMIVGLLLIISLFFAGNTFSQYWTALPPYNVMWPLWSPALSPIDPITGLTTPLLTSLTRDTILPVQPGLVWDPYQTVPYLLYNTPPTFGTGLLYYHDVYGLNPWPPNYLLDPITLGPAPIPLPLSWSLIAPYALGEFESYVPIANIIYSLTFGITGQGFLDLLQPFDIWGPTTRTGIPLTPIIL